MPLPYPDLNSARYSPDERHALELANDAYRERLDVAKACITGLLAAYAGTEIALPKPGEAAVDAVRYADALLSELAKPKPAKP